MPKRKRHGEFVNEAGSDAKLVTKQQVSDEYVILSAVNNDCPSKAAFAFSTGGISLYDLETMAKLTSYTGHQQIASGLKFSKDTDVLFSSSCDGNILTWDSRTGEKPVQTFSAEDEESKRPIPIACFDLNCEESYVCGGSELVRQDAFITFWDRRTGDQLGGYWDSHTEDVTQVQFHPSRPQCLLSSSTDGLVNVYDLYEKSEDDALTDTLNTEDSVVKFSWRTENETLSCITGTEAYQHWSVAKLECSLRITRDELSADRKVDYLIQPFVSADSHYLAAGNNDGSTHLYKCDGKRMKYITSLLRGHTDVVRAFSLCQKGPRIVTGGEDGQICVWNATL